MVRYEPGGHIIEIGTLQSFSESLLQGDGLPAPPPAIPQDLQDSGRLQGEHILNVVKGHDVRYGFSVKFDGCLRKQLDVVIIFKKTCLNQIQWNKLIFFYWGIPRLQNVQRGGTLGGFLVRCDDCSVCTFLGGLVRHSPVHFESPSPPGGQNTWKGNENQWK